MSDDLEFRFAVECDVPWLVKMNRQLIRDEGHRNKMSISELEKRMSDFLHTEYEAVIVRSNQNDIGYALYRRDPEWLYLKQIFVVEPMRRKGIGLSLTKLLKNHPGKDYKRIRTDVLVNNPIGIHFWKAVGFKEYCMTMELENQ